MDEWDHLRGLPGYRSLTSLGVEYIEGVFSNPPARVVGENSLLSVSGAYAARRFPHLVEYESAGCEKPFVLTSIVDLEVVDLLAQPSPLEIVAHDIRGRRRPRRYVPDYLEFKKNRFGIVEVKPESKLLEMSIKVPDWHRNSEDQWEFIPGQEIARRYGMEFSVFHPERYPKGYLSNLQIIARLPDGDLLAGRHGILERVRREVTERPMTILKICQLYDLTGAAIYQAIAKGVLFGLLDHQHLDPDFLVYGTSEQVEAHRKFIATAAAPGNFNIGPLHSRLLSASASELRFAQIAHARYDARRKQGLKKNATDYREGKKMTQAAVEHAPPIAAFVKDLSGRGGPGRNLVSETTKVEIVKHAKEYLGSGKVPKHSRIYAAYEVHAEERGLYVPSKETHRRIFRSQIAPEAASFLSGGKRAFHKSCPRTDGKQANPRLQVAGLIAHIDGVYGDVRSVPDENAEYLRPIFYPLIDDVTGFVFGMGVKIGRGSRLPVAMAHRDAYQRHGYLPGQIYHDWGSEFVNLFIPEMTAHFNVGYERRPAGAARFGGMGEMFNAQLSAFLQNLVGGTYFDKVGRAADGKKKSRATANLEVWEIIDAARLWTFKTWNEKPIGGEEKPPSALLADSIKCFPEAVAPVEDTLLARYYTSFPLAAKKFDYTAGFRYGGRGFSSTELHALIRGEQVPASPRLDCMDPSTIYALSSKGVVTLNSLDFSRVQGMDHSQRMQHLRDLIFRRSNSAKNQHDRLVAEFRQLKDMDKVKKAAKEIPKVQEVSHIKKETERRLDFSKVLSGALAPLRSLAIKGET